MGVDARKSDYLTVGFANAFAEQLIPFPENSSWDTFRNFAPNGKVPCLHHDDLIVWDSLAIVEYLAEHHSGIWPADRIAHAWARSVTAEMHSGFNTIRQECGMNCGLRIQLHQTNIESVLTLHAESPSRHY